MAQGYAKEVQGVLDGTLNVPAKIDGRVSGGRMRRYRATLSQADANVKSTNGDTNLLCRIPQGQVVAFGIINADQTLGAATIAIGPAATPGKYRAAAVFTAAAPTMFMPVAVEDDDPLAAYEDVLITIGGANLPAACEIVVDLFTSGR